MDFKFSVNALRIKKIAELQVQLDKEFARTASTLYSDFYRKKICAAKFWNAYKSALQKSLEGDICILETAFNSLQPSVEKTIASAESISPIKSENNEFLQSKSKLKVSEKKKLVEVAISL